MKSIYKLHIESEMKKRLESGRRITGSEPEYTTLRDVKLWMGTWNVNGKKIDENINIWMTGSVTGKPSADLYVVGLEEMVDLTATTVVLEAQSQKRAAVWLEMVSNALNRSAKSEVGVWRGREGRRARTCWWRARSWWACSCVCSSANRCGIGCRR